MNEHLFRIIHLVSPLSANQTEPPTSVRTRAGCQCNGRVSDYESGSPAVILSLSDGSRWRGPRLHRDISVSALHEVTPHHLEASLCHAGHQEDVRM